MSKFKNKPDINLYYSDTDSIIISGDIDPRYIGNELGQFKIEHIIKIAFFLGPKVYGFLTDKDQVVIKIKGLSQEAVKDVILKDLEQLLYENSEHYYHHTKMHKNLYESEISVQTTAYLLRATTNKRLSIYSYCEFDESQSEYQSGKKCLYKTMPYKYEDIIVERVSTKIS